MSALPAAVADMAAMLRVEVLLAVRIGLLWDETLLDDDEPPYEVLVPIFGGRPVGEFLRQGAMVGGMRATRATIKKLLAGSSLKQFQKVMLKYFGGASWNFAEIHVVGHRAIRYFEGHEVHDGEECEAAPVT